MHWILLSNNAVLRLFAVFTAVYKQIYRYDQQKLSGMYCSWKYVTTKEVFLGENIKGKKVFLSWKVLSFHT